MYNVGYVYIYMQFEHWNLFRCQCFNEVSLTGIFHILGCNKENFRSKESN